MLRDVGITRVDAERAANQPLPPIVRIGPRPRINPAEIDAHIARAHRLRSDATRRVVRGAARWMRDALRSLRPQPIVRARKLAPIAR
jgi:hypothetical protein